jgi:hypothetical protein
MKTIELEIPNDLAQKLESLSDDVKSFILNAITEKLKQSPQENLEQLLAEGYKVTGEEDLEITKMFETADFEHWK